MNDKATMGIMLLGVILLGAMIGLQVMGGSGGDVDRLKGAVSDLQVQVSGAKKAAKTADLAMATGSLWMMEHHLHEVEEAMEKVPVDWEEAEEEAEESIPWIKGAAWPKKIKPEADELAEAMEKLEHTLKTKDIAASEAAYQAAKKVYKHLHHEVMEAVGGPGGHGKKMAKKSDGHGKHGEKH